MLHNNIVKILEKKNEQAEPVENLPPNYLPYRFLYNLHLFLLWKKVKIFDFFKNQWLELHFLCIDSYDKWFCIKSWQKFANLLLLSKAPSQKKKSKNNSNKKKKKKKKKKESTFWKMSS